MTAIQAVIVMLLCFMVGGLVGIYTVWWLALHDQLSYDEYLEALKQALRERFP